MESSSVTAVQVYDGDGLYDDEYRVGVEATQICKKMFDLSYNILKSANSRERKSMADGRQYPALDQKAVGDAFNRLELIEDWLLRKGAYEPVAASIMRWGSLAVDLMKSGQYHYVDSIHELVRGIEKIHAYRNC